MKKAVFLFNEHHTPSHVDESANNVVQDSARQSPVQRLFPRKGGGEEVEVVVVEGVVPPEKEGKGERVLRPHHLQLVRERLPPFQVQAVLGRFP